MIHFYAQVRSVYNHGLEFTRPGQVPDDELYCSLQIILVDDDRPPRQIGEVSLRRNLLGQDLKIGDRFDLKFDRLYQPNKE